MGAGRGMRRVWLLLIAALMIGLLPGLADSASGAETFAWGASATRRTGETEIQAVQRIEAQAGRKLDVVRVFLTWNSPFPTAYHHWLRDTGHTILLSVKAQRSGGTKILWNDIANAEPGSALHSEIVSWADRISDFGGPVTFTFHHEPEAAANTDYGTAAHYIAAWRSVVSVFRARGVPNASYMWIMTAHSFGLPLTDRRRAEKWYPGDEYVDGIASDAYNWYRCRTGINTAWKSLAAIIEPMRLFGLQQHADKPMWLTEWASTEDPQAPGRKAQWIDEAKALFKRAEYAQFVGISYFNTPGNSSWSCAWPVDSSGNALTAFAAMGSDPFYGG